MNMTFTDSDKGKKNLGYLAIFTVHLVPVIALFTGTHTVDWIVLACLWPIQALGSTLGLHRYFAHKSFRTSRLFQGFLALCAAFAFGNPIGFAGKHRIHHKYSDMINDVHAPRQGAWQCWIGSLVDFGHSDAEVRRHCVDLCRYPELVWLHEHKWVPGLALALILFLVGGFSMMAIGFALGVVSIIHLGGAVNYFCHKYGSRRFETGDNSTNIWILSLLSLGESWHNNHHFYPASARAGFYWWEIDLAYLVICLLQKMGLIWAVRTPPERITLTHSASLAR